MMERFSQNNEQEIILDYFQFTDPKKQYVFLDVGANDGITLSNTRALALMDWAGVLVEASPKAFKRLVETYADNPLMDLHNIALGSANGAIMLNESGPLLGQTDLALVSTVHEHEMERFKSVVRYEQVPVNCLNWETFMANCTKWRHFDFISMDIEGSELEILPAMDLSETQLICIEWNGRDDIKREYEKYIKGFDLIHINGENLIYAR